MLFMGTERSSFAMFHYALIIQAIQSHVKPRLVAKFKTRNKSIDQLYQTTPRLKMIQGNTVALINPGIGEIDA